MQIPIVLGKTKNMAPALLDLPGRPYWKQAMTLVQNTTERILLFS